MMRNFALVLLLFTSIGVFERLVAAGLQVPSRTYTCTDEGLCNLNKPHTSGLSQGTCLMTCGKGNLWPNPTGSTHIGKSIAYFTSPTDLKFILENQPNLAAGPSPSFETLVKFMENNFLMEINKLNNNKKNKKNKSLVDSSTLKKNTMKSEEILIHVNIHDMTIVTPSDESYSLKISPQSTHAAADGNGNGNVEVFIDAQTVYGMRHGFETLSQFIVWDDIIGSLAIAEDVSIQDQPSFKYRGVMIDISRNFISMEKIQESVRAMGYNKMNVLHLHLSDTASIPITIPSNPNVTIYGAYDDDKIFTVESIKELVQYANGYGVMVLPEIDAPAHMSAGWQWGTAAGLGDLVLCTDAEGIDGDQWASDSLVEPPIGQLNLANENSFKILDSIYHDVIDQFQSSIFHIGGG